MKSRPQFVSNSSSTSFVIYLPANLRKDLSPLYKEMEDKLNQMWDNDEEQLNIGMGHFKRCVEEGYSLFEVDDVNNMDIAEEVFKPYILLDMQVASGDGEIVVLQQQDIERILKGEGKL